jgi:PAS domain S-box-containing protein
MCIVVLGSDLCIRRFTPLAEKILNLVPTDVGRPITNINPNFDFPNLEKAINEVIRNVRPKEEEVQDKEGRWYSLRLFPYKTSDNRIEGAVLVLVDVDKARATPLRDSAGKILKWFGTSTDIEDQKRAHLLLQESENWLRLIMESVKDFAIFTLDSGGLIVDWHAGAERVFGYSEAEILGQPADLIYTPEDRANGVPEREIATAAASGCALDERWQMRKDGRRIFVSGALRAIREEPGTLRGFTKVARDITERKQHEEELKKARDELEKKVAERTRELLETVQDLEAFSYSVSHDLRFPLRAMLGFARLALMEGGEQMPLPAKDFVERIINAASRLDRLIQDVLAYSRVTAAKIRLEPLDLEKLTRDVIEQYPGFQPDNVEIQIQSPLLPVMGHEASLTQCIANLLSNAIKFVGPGVTPRISISTEALDGMVKYWVADNGIGIDPANLVRIFSIFERVHAHQEYEGTGIGLSIIRKAAERMGGSVGVESELGQGSRFWIQLKRVESE